MSRKANIESYIRIQIKTNDGKLYATFCPSDRKHGGKDTYLGTVIDEENGIFYNRNSGFFRFTVKDGRTELNADELEYFELIRKQRGSTGTVKPNLMLDFGDAWFLEQVITSTKLKDIFSQICDEETDTLLSLIFFKLLDNKVNTYAQSWHEGSYAKLLYPHAHLPSQRISEFMERLGKEERMRKFFDAYFSWLKEVPGISKNILIDSTGLPNDICFEYSAINNHNGVISREARLIFVVERNSRFPVYFRYVSGNIVDVTTLNATLNQLKAHGILVNHGIMDAGYCSKKNIETLFEQEISFLIRLPNHSLSKDLIKQHGGDVFSIKYALRYGNRLIFMKRIPIRLYEHDGFAYVAIDAARRVEEQSKYINKGLDDPKKKMSDGELNSLGYFVLVSSQELETKEILPLYYMRQAIEQTFDFAKNDVDILPLRAHSEETFRGHLLLSFMATVLLIATDRLLKKRKKLSNFSAKIAFHAMRRMKCSVYTHNLVTSEANKIANLIFKELKLELPGTINL
jgi:hypothetical protein